MRTSAPPLGAVTHPGEGCSCGVSQCSRRSAENNGRTGTVKYGELEVVVLNCNLSSFGCGGHIPNHTACGVHLSAPPRQRWINPNLPGPCGCAPP